MKQKFLLTIGVTNLLGVIALSVFIFTKDQKVVHVDSLKLLNEDGMKDPRAAYKQKANAWKANIDTLVDEVQQQIFKYEKGSASMTAKERQLRSFVSIQKKEKAIDLLNNIHSIV